MCVYILKAFYKLRSEPYLNAFRHIAFENKKDLMEFRKSFYDASGLPIFCITVMKLQHQQIVNFFL